MTAVNLRVGLQDFGDLVLGSELRKDMKETKEIKEGMKKGRKEGRKEGKTIKEELCERETT
jgi:hypothetical protein